MSDGMVVPLFVGGIVQAVLVVFSVLALGFGGLVHFGRAFARSRRVGHLVVAFIAALTLLLLMLLAVAIVRPGNEAVLVFLAPFLFLPLSLLVVIAVVYFGRRFAKSGGWLNALLAGMALFIGLTQLLLSLSRLAAPALLLLLVALVVLVTLEFVILSRAQIDMAETRPAAAALPLIVVMSLLLPLTLILSMNFAVLGQSMEPAMYSGDFVLLKRGVFEPKRGDVAVVALGTDQRRDYISRVIGLPGEILEVRQGQVWVDGQTLSEPYPISPATYSTPPVKIGQGQIFILGDNRSRAADSHILGPVPLSNIVGKAYLRYWPPAHWGVLSSDR